MRRATCHSAWSTPSTSPCVRQVHQTGPLWRYARASMTVLGLLPPVYDRGRLLVDGGYVNNLPVDVMKAIFPSVAVVVAVDVENKDMSDVMNVYNYGDSLSVSGPCLTSDQGEEMLNCVSLLSGMVASWEVHSFFTAPVGACEDP